MQVQSLPNLTGFLSIGTTACLTALGITIAKVRSSARSVCSVQLQVDMY